MLKKKKKMDRQNPMTNGKTKLYRQNHTRKPTHTQSQKEKKEKIYKWLFPKSIASILG